jgi:hypothetical protein
VYSFPLLNEIPNLNEVGNLKLDEKLYCSNGGDSNSRTLEEMNLIPLKIALNLSF